MAKVGLEAVAHGKRIYGVVINGVPMVRIDEFKFITLYDYIMSADIKLSQIAS